MSIVMITTVHPRYDTRVYLKQAHDLAEIYGDNFRLVVADGLGSERKNSLQIRDLGIFSGVRIVRIFKGWLASIRFLRAHKAKIMHFHDPELLPVAMLGRVFGIKAIYDVHDDLSGSILHKHWVPNVLKKPFSITFGIFERIATLFCSQIVAATPEISKNFPSSKTTVVQNYPRLEELNTADPEPFEVRPANFFYVGGISRVRAFREPIQALSVINKNLEKNRDKDDIATLSICGSFRPESLMSEAQSLCGWEYVKFNGWCDRDQVKKELSQSIGGVVLFYNAPNNINSQPNKLFEYMAGGIPVIASNFPRWREIVETHNCGIVVDPENTDEVARAMETLMDDREKAQKIGDNGRRSVKQEFNWEAESKKLQNVYTMIYHGGNQ